MQKVACSCFQVKFILLRQYCLWILKYFTYVISGFSEILKSRVYVLWQKISSFESNISEWSLQRIAAENLKGAVINGAYLDEYLGTLRDQYPLFDSSGCINF
ncbi:uncharacterized protein LOC122511323 [Leptopilina heterotoma]|uniref:uncharacterized protein LOC122511323 n=1 Tax=Leptopilina heterotoma TaxID=63436 RepID=UPI001CA7E42F|nr:uncharacterized protein LOC122511323 [Leptopilina heterotoma]